MNNKVPLGELVVLQAGFGFPVDLQGRATGDYPFAKVGDISRCGRSASSVLVLADHYVDAKDLLTLRAKTVPPGSVLFAKIGEAIRQNHRVVAGCEMLIDNNAMAAIPSNRVDSRFLYHYLKTVDFYSLAPATTVPALRKSDLAKLPIPCPPLPEQHHIAAILDKADALRAKRREALAQLDRLAQSIFVEMFGDPVSNERNWPIAAVGDICNLVRGSSPRPQGDVRYFGGPIPRLMVADITRDGWLVTPKIDSLTLEGAKRSRPVKAGTVVMAVSGNVGLVSRLAIDACVHDGFVAFTALDESVCIPGFFLALLHYSKAQHEKSKAGAIFINLTTTDIKGMNLPLPSLQLQREFVARLSRVKSLEDTAKTAHTEVSRLFSSLQHRAFRGEL